MLNRPFSEAKSQVKKISANRFQENKEIPHPTERFAKDFNITTPHPHAMKYGRGVAAFGGQWTVGDLRLFTSPIYKQLADRAKEEGMFEHRWADQLLFAAGTIMLGGYRVCFHEMFQDQTLFVHKKKGFLDTDLVRQCGVPDPAVFDSYPRAPGDVGPKGESGGGDEL